MLIPAEEALPEIIRGGTWEIEIELFQDQGHSEPFNITGGGWTASVIVNGVKTFVSGEGLTIGGASNNKITLLMTATETAVITAEEASYYLQLTKTGNTSFPLKGTIRVVSP